MKIPVSVIGLGKLGSVLAAVLAHKGHTVVGVDVNKTFVDAINCGISPVAETDLDQLIAHNTERLYATQDYAYAVANSQVSFVIVPTPSQLDRQFSLKYILSACEPLAQAIRTKGQYHLVVIVSTVMPGDTGGRIRECLESASGLTCGQDFGLCYSPEFIALGNIVRDLQNPDMLLIGESDSRAGDLLCEIYKGLVDNQPNWVRTNWVNAELIKLSVNTYVTTKISYANMISEICDQLPGADAQIVTEAIGLDTRIGRKYLRSGLGFGGPCFPRDNEAFARLALNVGVSADIATATQTINNRQAVRLAQLVLQHRRPTDSVTVLGLSYKPNTNFTERSQSLELCKILTEHNIPVTVWDPEAMPNSRVVLGDTVTYADNLNTAIKSSQVIVLTTEWPIFQNIDRQMLNHCPTVIDCWRQLDWDKLGDYARFVTLGRGE